jgi:hypothetical protein
MCRRECGRLLALPWLLCATMQAHVVSMSSGELRVSGSSATYQLRMPAYEVEHVSNPETELIAQIWFEGARLVSSACKKESDTYICNAAYEFETEVPDRLKAECNLFRITVPNHVHVLYAAQGANTDQVLFDQTAPRAEIRFRPPSASEILIRDAMAGATRLFRSVSALLFLPVLVLAARSWREAVLLSAVFLTAEWLARPLAAMLPLGLSPAFLEAAMALTALYLAAEILFLPESTARWMIVPFLGLVHGFAFAALPAVYLGSAAAAQAVILALLAAGALRMPRERRRPLAWALAGTALGWFAWIVVA